MSDVNGLVADVSRRVERDCSDHCWGAGRCDCGGPVVGSGRGEWHEFDCGARFGDKPHWHPVVGDAPVAALGVDPQKETGE
jgi:hypothetical protein